MLLADDHGIVRDGLRCLLDNADDIKVVAAIATIGEAVREIERLAPRVAVLKFEMNGVDATRLVVEKAPQLGVIVLADHGSPRVLQRVLEAGALGYLTRESSGEELFKAIREVAAGKRYLERGLAGSFVDIYRGARAGTEGVEGLTLTERNILRLVANGGSNPSISRALGLSTRTVETYRLRMMRKLGIDSFASLVKYAIRHGVVPLE
ncbi:MAG: LuxR C-terminal-related transcriptional regulator [Burkholderiales bacterium]